MVPPPRLAQATCLRHQMGSRTTGLGSCPRRCVRCRSAFPAAAATRSCAALTACRWYAAQWMDSCWQAMAQSQQPRLRAAIGRGLWLRCSCHPWQQVQQQKHSQRPPLRSARAAGPAPPAAVQQTLQAATRPPRRQQGPAASALRCQLKCRQQLSERQPLLQSSSTCSAAWSCCRPLVGSPQQAQRSAGSCFRVQWPAYAATTGCPAQQLPAVAAACRRCWRWLGGALGTTCCRQALQRQNELVQSLLPVLVGALQGLPAELSPDVPAAPQPRSIIVHCRRFGCSNSCLARFAPGVSGEAAAWLDLTCTLIACMSWSVVCVTAALPG